MSPLALLFIGAAVVLCLLPLALYLLWLSRINGRSQPTLISGSIDFIFLIGGISGFLILGGPILISFFDGTLSAYWYGSSLKAVALSFANNHRLIIALCFFYVGLVGFLMIFGYRRRRRLTVIYNATGDRVMPILGAIVGCDPAILETKPIAIPVTLEGNRPPGQVSMEEETYFRSIALRWEGLRLPEQSRFESRLTERMKGVETGINPSTDLLLNIALGIGLVLFLWVGFMFFMVIRS